MKNQYLLLGILLCFIACKEPIEELSSHAVTFDYSEIAGRYLCTINVDIFSQDYSDSLNPQTVHSSFDFDSVELIVWLGDSGTNELIVRSDALLGNREAGIPLKQYVLSSPNGPLVDFEGDIGLFWTTVSWHLDEKDKIYMLQQNSIGVGPDSARYDNFWIGEKIP